eukprot:GEMP01009936.1.p1 GENE.GEMP01009936.1~~GEMP01009936.1.p1  ORF type:complete len:550 (+),score=94.90 GEMP01009936.1:74-1651(+)
MFRRCPLCVALFATMLQSLAGSAQLPPEPTDLLSQEIALLEENIVMAEERILSLQDLRHTLISEGGTSPLLTDVPDVGPLFSSPPDTSDPRTVPEDYLFRKFSTQGQHVAVIPLKNQRVNTMGTTTPTHVIAVADATNVRLYTPEGDLVFEEPHGATNVTRLVPSSGHDHSYYIVVSEDESGTVRVLSSRIRLHTVELKKERQLQSGVKLSQYLDVLPLNITTESLSFSTKAPIADIASMGNVIVLTSRTGMAHMYQRNGTESLSLSVCSSTVLLKPATNGLIYTCAQDGKVGIIYVQSLTTLEWPCVFPEPLNSGAGAVLAEDISRKLITLHASGKISSWKISNKDTCKKEVDFRDPEMGATLSLSPMARNCILASSPRGRAVFNTSGSLIWYMRENITTDIYQYRRDMSDLMVSLDTNGTITVHEVFMEPMQDQVKVSDGFSMKGPLLGMVVIVVVGWQMAKRKISRTDPLGVQMGMGGMRENGGMGGMRENGGMGGVGGARELGGMGGMSTGNGRGGSTFGN